MNKTLFFIFSLFFSVCLFGQNKERSDLATSNINPILLLNNPNQVVRKAVTTFNVKNKSTGVLQYEEAITLLNDESDANALYVTYDSDSKITDFDAYLYDASGALIRRIRNDEFKDIARVDGFSLYQDNRVKYVEVSHSQFPYTIVWYYTKTVQGIEFATFPDWHPQEYDEAVEFSQFKIIIPGDQEVHFQALNMKEPAEISTMEKEKMYRWTLKESLAISPEPYSPGSYYILPKVLISPSQFVVEGMEGSLSSWESYGQFMQRLYKERDNLPAFAKKEIQNLVANTTTNREKIELIYKYLQEKMRYVSIQLGIGGWQPFSAEYVATNSYGDCKALSNYMKCLLEAAEIQAYPALIKNGDLYYEVQEDFAFPAFNHVILYVPEEDMWLECTSNHYPTGYIGSGNYNRSALLVTEEGGKLVHTPTQSKSQNQELISLEMQIDTNGAADLQYKSRLLGQLHERIRYIFHNYAEEDQRKWVLEQLEIPNFQLTDYVISTEKNEPVSTFDYHGKSSKYVSISGKRVFIPINKVSVFSGVPEKEENRLFPIVIKEEFQETLTIKIQIPDNWVIESMPASEKTVESPFGKYRITCQQRGNTIEINRQIEVKQAEAAPEDYPSFRKFFRDISRAEQSMIVVKL